MKVGIVGVGKLGSFHCNALMQMPEAELAGVFDTDNAQLTAVAQKFKTTAFNSVEELVDHVDLVGVVVPTTFHLDVAKIAIQKKKPVFVEKPIALTIEQAEEMVELAEKNAVPLQIGHIERFNPAIRALETSELNPLFIESHRLAPFNPRGTDVAVILDLMIHDIDIILSMVNSPVRDIFANGVAVVSDEADIANARLEFENGCIANITASRISHRKMRKMRIFQKDMYASIDFLERSTDVYKLLEEGDNLPNAIQLGEIEKGKHKRHIVFEKPVPPESDAMQSEWRAFFDAIEHNKRPIVNGRDGLEALIVAMQIRELVHRKERRCQKKY